VRTCGHDRDDHTEGFGGRLLPRHRDHGGLYGACNCDRFTEEEDGETVRLTAAAKFRAVCPAATRQSEVRTAFHVGLWMHAHEEQHRQLDQLANGPLLDTGTG
jgi:hypothetical protein